jgi:predicted transposase/invertase (TIGR01784 family)
MDPSVSPSLSKLPPKFDAVFLRLFNEDDHARLLIALLNGLLKLPPRLRIVELTLLPPRIQDTAAEKQVVLDIRAVSVMGDRYNLDVQVSPFAEYENRAVYYLTGLHHGQLPAGAPYSRLRPAISVHVLDFPLFPREPSYCASARATACSPSSCSCISWSCPSSSWGLVIWWTLNKSGCIF